MDSASTCRGCGRMKAMGDLCCPHCWGRLPRLLRSRLTFAKCSGLVGSHHMSWTIPWDEACRSWDQCRQVNRRLALARAAAKKQHQRRRTA